MGLSVKPEVVNKNIKMSDFYNSISLLGRSFFDDPVCVWKYWSPGDRQGFFIYMIWEAAKKSFFFVDSPPPPRLSGQKNFCLFLYLFFVLK